MATSQPDIDCLGVTCAEGPDSRASSQCSTILMALLDKSRRSAAVGAGPLRQFDFDLTLSLTPTQYACIEPTSVVNSSASLSWWFFSRFLSGKKHGHADRVYVYLHLIRATARGRCGLFPMVLSADGATGWNEGKWAGGGGAGGIGKG